MSSVFVHSLFARNKASVESKLNVGDWHIGNLMRRKAQMKMVVLSFSPMLAVICSPQPGRARVSTHLDRRKYPTGIERTPEDLAHLRLFPHEVLPHWNYTIQPNL
jgi:hypothetical protein